MINMPDCHQLVAKFADLREKSILSVKLLEFLKNRNSSVFIVYY